jgi:hypothetical protein
MLFVPPRLITRSGGRYVTEAQPRSHQLPGQNMARRDTHLAIDRVKADRVVHRSIWHRLSGWCPIRRRPRRLDADF